MVCSDFEVLYEFLVDFLVSVKVILVESYYEEGEFVFNVWVLGVLLGGLVVVKEFLEVLVLGLLIVFVIV